MISNSDGDCDPDSDPDPEDAWFLFPDWVGFYRGDLPVARWSFYI